MSDQLNTDNSGTTTRPPALLFGLGRLYITPGALAALDETKETAEGFLRRHQRGDWGELSEEDKRENHFSLAHNFRLLSAYRTTAGVKLWVITERSRSATTILLPSDY